MKIMASGPNTSRQIDGETMETVTDFIFLGSKITADAECSHEIKRHLLLGREAMTNLDSILKSKDIGFRAHLKSWMISSQDAYLGFPGGSVVKNPPANAADTDSIPGLGRSHVPCSNWACAPRLLSLCFEAWEPQLLKPTCPRACALQQEKSPQWGACAPQLESSPQLL